MPLTPATLTRKIKDILRHVQPLPDEAKAPSLHYQRTVSDIWGSLAYVERLIAERDRYQSVVDRHLGRLYGMALVNLVETFERFLKEAAAECVDYLAEFVIDDRFNVFSIQGSTLASHFGAGTLGKSLCESTTWLDCEDINRRFRKLLSDPFQVGGQSFDLSEIESGAGGRALAVRADEFDLANTPYSGPQRRGHHAVRWGQIEPVGEGTSNPVACPGSNPRRSQLFEAILGQHGQRLQPENRGATRGLADHHSRRGTSPIRAAGEGRQGGLDLPVAVAGRRSDRRRCARLTSSPATPLPPAGPGRPDCYPGSPGGLKESFNRAADVVGEAARCGTRIPRMPSAGIPGGVLQSSPGLRMSPNMTKTPVQGFKERAP